MRSGWRELPRTGTSRSALLAIAALLAGCVAQPGGAGYPAANALPPYPAGAAPSGRRIGVLVPLSGASAQTGQSLLRGARLALQAGGGAAFDEKDTAGTPTGAAKAADAAIAAGAGILVGPLTAPETDAVAAVAGPRNVPVLALTSDGSKARPGVWPMGITPGQQMATIAQAVRRSGRFRLAALLPTNAFGDALANALSQAAQDAGLPPPRIVRYGSNAGLDAGIGALAAPEPAPPSIDALLLGTTVEASIAALPALRAAGLGPDRVRLLGTALWARGGAALAPLAGGWFAGPDPQALRIFEANYTALFGSPPRDFASLAFDAAAVAKAAEGPTGVNPSVLVNPAGFNGANGSFVLLPDGHVQRSLMLFEIGVDGPRPVDAGI